jgi:hypothetical protein
MQTPKASRKEYMQSKTEKFQRSVDLMDAVIRDTMTPNPDKVNECPRDVLKDQR